MLVIIHGLVRRMGGLNFPPPAPSRIMDSVICFVSNKLQLPLPRIWIPMLATPMIKVLYDTILLCHLKWLSLPYTNYTPAQAMLHTSLNSPTAPSPNVSSLSKSMSPSSPSTAIYTTTKQITDLFSSLYFQVKHMHFTLVVSTKWSV